jgi:hypothetical protein
VDELKKTKKMQMNKKYEKREDKKQDCLEINDDSDTELNIKIEGESVINQ